MAWPTDPLDVRCVFAFGANLAAVPTSWTFKDCTADLRIAEEVNVKVGRSDRAKQPEPNEAHFTLNNFSGQYTVDNPVGVNFPNVVENVPGIIAVARNLNPTFEVDASDWVAQNGTVARSTVRAFKGTGSLLLTPTGGLSFASAGIAANIPVRPGGAVYLDAWVYSVAGWANTAVSVDWFDGSSTYTSTTAGPTVSVPAGVWTYLGAYLGAAPSNAASAVGRVVMSGTPGAGNTLWIDEARTSIPRLCGYVDGWTPQFNDTGSLATVAVSMSGARRRLGRGNPALRSALTRGTNAGAPVTLWPCEDGANATQIAEFTGQGAPLAYSGSLTFSTGTPPAGSAPVLNLGAASSLGGSVSMASTNAWTVAFLANIPASVAGDTVIFQWTTSGTYARMQYVLTQHFSGSTDYVRLQGFNAAGTMILDDAIPFDVGSITQAYGHWLYFTIGGKNGLGNGFHAMYSPEVNTRNLGSWVNGGDTLGAVTSVSATANLAMVGAGLGQISVWNRSLNDAGEVDRYRQLVRGYVGETAADRITRLCNEQGVPLATINNPQNSMPMGPQSQTDFLALLLECETADLGMLFEPFDTFGFGYIVRSDLYNLPVTLTIDNGQGQLTPPFAPLHDDLQRQNDVTATRQGGASARFVGDTSRGIYQTSVTLNVLSDSMLLDIAGWLAHLGSPRGRLRHPSLTVNFTGSPTLAPVFFGSRGMGIRAQVINPPTQLPQGADLLLSGYTERLGFKQWVVSLLGSPYDVWQIFQLAATTGDTSPYCGHLEADTSTLHAGIAAQPTNTVESWTVDTGAGNVLWTTVADDFPFDINIEGEQITVTNITGASSPQTFFVKRAINGAVKAHSAGALVSLWAPLVLGL